LDRDRSRDSFRVSGSPRSMNAQGDETRHALPVAHNHFRQLERDEVERSFKRLSAGRDAVEPSVSRQPIRQDQHRIVGAHVAVDGDTIETLFDRLLERHFQICWLDRRIGRNEAEHRRVRRHLRLNHSGALADSADANRNAADLEFDSDLFPPRIGSHNRFRDLPGAPD
jgi:hypothetical protein